MVVGIVILTTAPTPKGFLVVIEKVYVVAVDTVVERGVRVAAVRVFGDIVTVAVLLLKELLLLLKCTDIVLDPESTVEVANSPLVILTPAPEAIVWGIDEVGKVIPVVVLAPVIPAEVTFVVTAIPR